MTAGGMRDDAGSLLRAVSVCTERVWVRWRDADGWLTDHQQQPLAVGKKHAAFASSTPQFAAKPQHHTL